MAADAILNLFESKIAPLDPPTPKTPPYNQTSDDRLRTYGHLKFFQHGGGRHLVFVRTVNRTVRSAVPENPTIEPNMKWLSIVTVALSVTIRPEFAIECPTLKSTGRWVTFGPNLGLFSLELTRHVSVAKSEHSRLTNGEIIFEEFQPM